MPAYTPVTSMPWKKTFPACCAGLSPSTGYCLGDRGCIWFCSPLALHLDGVWFWVYFWVIPAQDTKKHQHTVIYVLVLRWIVCIIFMCTLSLVFKSNLSLSTHFHSQTQQKCVHVHSHFTSSDTNTLAGNWVQPITHSVENPTKQHYMDSQLIGNRDSTCSTCSI